MASPAPVAAQFPPSLGTQAIPASEGKDEKPRQYLPPEETEAKRQLDSNIDALASLPTNEKCVSLG